jgi:hypothetical protein
MSDWMEHSARDDWPQDENLEWQKNVDGVWKEAPEPAIAWSNGHRIRYRERESEMLRVYCHSNHAFYMDIPWTKTPEWVRLAAPIATYYKNMKYMACDIDGRVCVFDYMPKAQHQSWLSGFGYSLIAVVPPEAMPADWEAAIVELVHEGGEV